ncbi:MAG: hypothetical protein U9M97_01750 [Candidatus Hadarchaeota archaeon]|nr:hypothetical protein [Candidatus Hadarchaeota archaeon]
MGHISVDISAVSTKGKRDVKGLIIDTGATYTVLSRDVLEAVGALKLPRKFPLKLGDGRSVEAEVYSLWLELGDGEGPVIALTFEGAQQVIGVQTLESLGLKVNSITGELEETRPKGMAYFYLLE